MSAVNIVNNLNLFFTIDNVSLVLKKQVYYIY